MQTDITIIGAGVVGLAVASEVAALGREVYLLEQNDRHGLEQSSRNSEVIHAGIYYQKDSLKAALCLEGNRLLYEACDKYGLPHRRCGKIIAATNSEEVDGLPALFQNGKDNGVPLEMLSRSRMQHLEPNMKAKASFLSPTTGIIDSHSLMGCFLSKAQAGGVHISYRTEVTGIEKLPDGYEVAFTDPSGAGSFRTSVLINCAGLHSDAVAAMAGIDIDDAGYRLHWCKGEYFGVSDARSSMVNRLIYLVPTGISVGAHVCLDVTWRLRLGPLFRYVDRLDYRVDDSGMQPLLNSSIMKALPFIQPEDLSPESAGIMAMLQGQGEGFRDFVIRHEKDRGLPGFINLVGIESPGLTSSPAIGRYVARMVKDLV
jgi:L-2-hydroxyglutarate oxidase LhgO